MQYDIASLWTDDTTLGPFIEGVIGRACARAILTPAQAGELTAALASLPKGDPGQLAPLRRQQFIAFTYQVLAICLEDDQKRKGFVNPLLKLALEDACRQAGGRHWALETVSEKGRQGCDRRFTFGQVQGLPGEQDGPSFFGGTWLARCDGETRRIVFSIHADPLPDGVQVERPQLEPELARKVESLVRARGPHPSTVQVDPKSPLGLWISRLYGTSNVGQHEGHIPLGVLSEAVSRALDAQGLTHYLLSPSRRDPPTQPWHSGTLLRRQGESFEFAWEGFALTGTAQELVKAQTVITLSAKILHILH